MPDKKADDKKAVPEEEVLVKRVDSMLKPGQPDSAPVAPKADPAAIDIFKDPKTAPEVPTSLLKEIGAEASKPEAKAKTAVPAETKVEAEDIMPAAEIDDVSTDKAVDDIVAHESDEVLAAEDAAAKHTSITGNKTGWKAKLKSIVKNKWTWIGVGVVVVTVFAVPFTRYKILGLVIKESVSVTVTDSKTNTPVSSAVVSLGGASAKTNAEGKATVKAPVGSTKLSVSKQYYKTYSRSALVGFKSGTGDSVKLVATGRQVPITVLNTITGKPLVGADITILKTSAKTNKLGQASIVLPTTGASDSATVSLSGYNTAHASVQVTSSVVAANTIHLTPAGQIYFLSNLSGTIDVVKTNLDGTGRQTVLAGTGKEDPNTTSLLASRDWQYLVLKAQRTSSTQAALYLINTSTDKVTEFDSTNADFTLVGWYGHDFIYDAVSNSVPAYQSGHELLKSYDADNGQLSLLDQNQAAGDANSYGYQSFSNFYILNNLVVYNTQWYSYDTSGSDYDLTGKNDTIRGVQPNGQNKKDYQTVLAAGAGYIQAALYEPQAIYYDVYTYATNATTYYEFEDQSVSTATNVNQTQFNQGYPTYLLSPSGNQTFWTELRDGKNTLFTGDANADSPKQIASLSDYSPYGWYSDDYVLVSKDSDELYVMPASGLVAGQQPVKITDYYKPAQSYNGYGYGYGGL